MTVRESAPLSSLTTFKLGGPARYHIACENDADIAEAIAFARALPWYAIGEGSNILAADAGFDGVLMRMTSAQLSFEESGDHVLLLADANVGWDALVSQATSRELWGVENLAGIPGTAGAAPVQNIGAYGAELADTLVSVRAFDTNAGTAIELTKEACELGYRESRFKRDRSLIITQITLSLSKNPAPRLSYKDLVARSAAGAVLETPAQIADTVRHIRSKKFPDLAAFGTAGSFFKNPIIAEEAYERLKTRYPDMPGYAGKSGVKVPLAWILDSVLNLRGSSVGKARLFEAQPLVIVTELGASARDVDQLASTVEQKVFDATGIKISREVQSLS